jgi:hypothetical protein
MDHFSEGVRKRQVTFLTAESTEYAEMNQAIETESERLNHITEMIIGTAIEVHRSIGPGLLESAYV